MAGPNTLRMFEGGVIVCHYLQQRLVLVRWWQLLQPPPPASGWGRSWNPNCQSPPIETAQSGWRGLKPPTLACRECMREVRAFQSTFPPSLGCLGPEFNGTLTWCHPHLQKWWCHGHWGSPSTAWLACQTHQVWVLVGSWWIGQYRHHLTNKIKLQKQRSFGP